MENHPMRISIIGSGRLGNSLLHGFQNTAHSCTLHHHNEPVLPSEVVFIAVPDRHIGEVANTIESGPVLFHCAGSLGLEVLQPHSPAGVFHPLMTFPGPEVQIPNFSGLPIGISGDEKAILLGERLAKDLCAHPFQFSGNRALYHAAAVMAGNFGASLFQAATEVMMASGMDPDQAREMLKPLAIQSIENAADYPHINPTGPIVRGDKITIGQHKSALTTEELLDHLALFEALVTYASKGQTSEF